MKKIFFLVFLLLLPIVSSLTLNQNQVYTYEERQIEILGIQASKILVSVDGQKDIVSLNQQKTINGIEITVTEILFVDAEASTAAVDLSTSYICGDKTCDSFETYQSCCKDCGCGPKTTDKCVENSCITPECSKDSDCNDNSELTEDKCEDYKCKHRKIKCENNSNCNDNNPDTDDLCDKGSCRNILNYVCKVDLDCEDNNECTVDRCVNKDCINEKTEDCEVEVKEKVGEDTEVGTENNVNEVKENKNFISRFFSWIFSFF